jgi:hypothetical protein
MNSTSISSPETILNAFGERSRTFWIAGTLSAIAFANGSAIHMDDRRWSRNHNTVDNRTLFTAGWFLSKASNVMCRKQKDVSVNRMTRGMD